LDRLSTEAACHAVAVPLRRLDDLDDATFDVTDVQLVGSTLMLNGHVDERVPGVGLARLPVTLSVSAALSLTVVDKPAQVSSCWRASRSGTMGSSSRESFPAACTSRRVARVRSCSMSVIIRERCGVGVAGNGEGTRVRSRSFYEPHRAIASAGAERRRRMCLVE